VEARGEIAAERQRTGQRVYGRRAVLQQSWPGHPSTREPRRNLRPRVATRNQWARLDALSRDREFIVAYTGARKTWREDPRVKFPPGTYWLRRFVSVPVVDNGARHGLETRPVSSLRRGTGREPCGEASRIADRVCRGRPVVV